MIGEDGIRLFLGGSSSNATGLFGQHFRDGKYAACAYEQEFTRVYSDRFGLEPVYYYSDDEFWAVSNSVVTLARCLKESGVSCRLRRRAISPFRVEIGAFGTQLVSCSTWIEEIKLMPPGCYLEASSGAKRLQLKRFIDNGVNSHDDDHDYVSSVENFFVQTLSRMKALANATSGAKFVDLSGGQDSRLLYGLAASCADVRDQLFARSNRNAINDYVVAKSLAEKFPLKLHAAPLATERLSGEIAFDLWEAHNASVYRPIYVPLTATPRNVLQFNGASPIASAYVSMPAEARLNSWSKILTPRDFKLVTEEFKRGLQDIGSALQETNSIDRHYASYRARMHYGRASYNHLQWFNDSPLMSSSFLTAARKAERLGYTKDRFMCDLMTSVDPRLAIDPFSTEKSQFTTEDIELSYQSMPRFDAARVATLNCYGSLNHAEPQPSAVSAELDFQKIFKEKFLERNFRGDSEFPPHFVAAARRELAESRDSREWGRASVLMSFASVVSSIR